MKVKEVIEKVNEQGVDIYDLSEAEGFSRGTLRQRLIRQGYEVDNISGKWKFTGAAEMEPLDKVITYPSKRKQTVTIEERPHQRNSVRNVDLFTAMLQLPVSTETYTDSFKADKTLIERMKNFIKQVPLPAGKIYSIAVYEFLEKYEPIIEELKNSKK